MPATDNSHNIPDRRSEPDCFQLISKADFETISKNRTQLTYLKGEQIFKQGAFAPHVLFIQSGLVKVFIQTGGGRKMNLWIARKGEFLAFSTLFEENIYPYSAVAIKDAEILMIEKDSLKQLLMTNHEFALRITSKNYGTEKHLVEIVNNLSFKQMRGKLATSLLYLTSDLFVREGLFSCLTRQDIADFASISVESVIKFLKEFEREGIIELSGKEISVTDLEKLSEISRIG
jgi:CRP/FNR family transcriptional regulator